MQKYSTRQVAHILGIKPSLLSRALWDGVVISPPKGPSGSYLWSIADIESAAWALKRFHQFKIWQDNRGGVR